MKRSDFIKLSASVGLGLYIFPWESLAGESTGTVKTILLPDLVPQPRHGNFCGEALEVDELLKIHSRDRLLKNGLDLSKEDLLSINMEFKGERFNLTVSHEECWVNYEDKSEKVKVYPGIYPIMEDMQLIMGYANVIKCSTNSRLYILPLAGQFKLDDLLYHENICVMAEDIKMLEIETSQSSRILLLTV